MTVEQFLERVLRLAETDDRISAVLLYGSRAAGSADEHSDVDIGLVVTDAAHAQVLAERNALVLRATVVPAEHAPMRKAALAVLTVYRELAQELAATHGIPYPGELDRLLSSRL